ncbi:hypothetical protein QL285_013886 [Trifolium repens]|nr:hypothetical protein QL285_013886 [Trifolium repens]
MDKEVAFLTPCLALAYKSSARVVFPIPPFFDDPVSSSKKTIANARRSYGTQLCSTVKSTVSAAVKTHLCSLSPTNQSQLLSFSSAEESFHRFSQQLLAKHKSFRCCHCCKTYACQFLVS